MPDDTRTLSDDEILTSQGGATMDESTDADQDDQDADADDADRGDDADDADTSDPEVGPADSDS
jgi:hypothetical protein